MLFFERPDVKKLEAKGDIEGLIKALKYTKDMHIRGDAALALARIGDARVVESLIAALEDEEAYVRREVARGLGYTGDARAVEPLIDHLEDKSDWVCEDVTKALGQIRDARAVEPLITKLVDGGPSLRKAIIEAFKQIDGTVDSLIIKLEDPNESVRSSAAEALGEIHDKRSVDSLITKMEDANESVRRSAAVALAELGWRPRENSRAAATFWAAKTDLLIARGDSHVLIKIGSPVVEPLIAMLNNRNNDRWIRGVAVRALGQIGDVRAVEPLIAKLGDEAELVRGDAAKALGQIGDARAVEPLIAKLGDEQKYVREAADKALEQLGWTLEKSTDREKVAYWVAKEEWDKCAEMGTSAVEQLVAELDNQNYSVREFATKVLMQIGDARAVESLIIKLGDENNSVRESAARALGQIGGARAVPPLIAKLEDKDRMVRIAVAKALAELGWTPSDKSTAAAIFWAAMEKWDELAEIGTPAVELFITMLEDEDKYVRSEAALALGQIGDTRAVDSLIATLNDESESVYAVQALAKIGDARAVGPLISQLKGEMCETAAKALAQISERIRDEEGLNEQMEQLRGMLINNDYYVRQRARKAAKSFAEQDYYPSLKRAFQASMKLQEACDEHGRELTPVTLCRDALELEPGFSAASVYLSYIYREYHKEYRKALKWSQEAIRIDPQNEDAWTEQGNVHIELGNAVAATQAFAKAVTLNRHPGKKVQPYLRLIVVYDVLGMSEDKAKVFSTVLDTGLGLDPDEERRWEKMVLKAPQRALRKAAKIEW